MKLDKLKTGKTKISSKKNLLKKIIAVVVSVGIFVLSYIIITRANTAAKDTIPVIQIKSTQGIPEKAVLSKDNLGKYDIVKKEYTDDMVLAEDLEKVIDNYAAHYLRKGAILHKDEYVNELPLKNEWLYEMGDDEEALSIKYDYLESGGDILTPGDRIRVRITYDVDAPANNGEGDPEDFYGVGKSKVKKVDVLFNSISVIDMLNKEGHSIYEVYKEVMRLPEDQRQKVLKSEEFMDNIKPKSLVVAANSEQISNYIKMENMSGKKFYVTILSRHEYSTILDWPTLEKEIEVWQEKQ